MFTFALQVINIFLFIFNLFPLFAERGRRNLEESIQNEITKPLTGTTTTCVRYRVSKWSLYLLCSVRFIFSERKCISKSWGKLLNYKPENRIHWLFTDFDNIKDFPWLFKTFPDFSDLEKCSFFLWLLTDRGNPEYLNRNINAFKCNLKELTTKSAWVPRSAVFGMRMPGGWLHRSCDSLARSVFPSCWVLSAIFFAFLC